MVSGCAEGVSNVRRELKSCPQGDTLLAYLKSQERVKIAKAFDDIVESNLALLRKRGCFRVPVPIAIDWCNVRYYGSRKAEMLVGAEHRRGTSYAYRYLTAGVLKGGERLTLAVLPVSSRKLMKELLERFFERIRKLSVRAAYVVLDCGFFSEQIIDYLASTGLRYCLRRDSSKSLRKLKHGTVLKKRTEKGVQYRLVVAYHRKKKKKYFFITNMALSAEQLLECYDLRWGIETSYRMHGQFLIKTTSKNYTIRLFYFLFACAMYNCWVLFEWIAGRHITAIEVKIAFIMISVFGGGSFIEAYVHT